MNFVVEIWTDGACAGNPGPGGYAAIMKYDDEVYYSTGREESSTNQRMEIMAATEGLSMCKDYAPKAGSVIIYSDSAYVCNCFKQKWYLNWQRNGWLNAKKQPVANKELWENLINLIENLNNHGISVTFEKVKGHSGNPMNEECDRLAVMARKGEKII